MKGVSKDLGPCSKTAAYLYTQLSHTHIQLKYFLRGIQCVDKIHYVGFKAPEIAM